MAVSVPGALTRPILLMVVILPLWVGCGLPAVAPAPDRPIKEQTDLDSSGGFALREGREQRQYRGTLLLWRDTTTRDEVAAVFRATQEANEAYATSRELLLEIDRSDLAPLEARQGEIFAELEELASQQGSPYALRVQRLDAGHAWFTNWSEGLAKEYGEAFDKERAETILNWYCDAKLWELAVQPWLSQNEFFEIPVAHPQCHKSFLAQGYFESSLCESPEPAQQPISSAFGCVWQALAKTRFVTLGPMDAGEMVPVLEAVAQNSDFKNWVAGSDSGAAFCGLQAFHVKRLPSFRPLPFETSCVIDDKGTAFRWGARLDRVSSDSRPEQLSAFDLGRLVDGQVTQLARENTRIRYPLSLIVVESAGRARESSPLTPVEVASDAFAERLSALGDRKASCGDLRERLSAADLYFSLPFSLDRSLHLSPEDCLDAPDANPFPELRGDGGIVELRKQELRNALEGLGRERRERLSQFCDLTNGSPGSAARRAEMDARVQQTQVVEGSAILAARDFTIDLLPEGESDTSEGLVRVELSFLPGEVAASGCYDSRSGASVSCQRENSTEVRLEVRTDPDGGGLRIQLDLSQLSASSRELASFPVAFRGGTLQTTLYANALGNGRIPYVSGRVTIETSSGETALGEAAYLFEVDEGYRKSAELVSECVSNFRAL